VDVPVAVAEDQRRVVAGEVEQLVAVDVDQAAPMPLFQDRRIGRIEERRPRVGPREVVETGLEVLVGGRRQPEVGVLLRGRRSPRFLVLAKDRGTILARR
jgi:hypothetical protein